MAREIFNGGLKSATNATDEARARGPSIELVQELWREADESDDAAGMLANGLTGQRGRFRAVRDRCRAGRGGQDGRRG